MPGENLTIDEARERAGLLSVQGYDVTLDLRSAVEPVEGGGAGTFRSTTVIRFRCTRPGASTHVDLIAPAVRSITLNGRAVDPATAFDGARIHLDGLAEANEVVVDADCAYSRSGEGLHRFTDPVDGETYLYTQYEPADSRRVFANFEQPDLKAPFTLTVTAPAHWTVLGNETAGAPEDAGGTAATWKFAPTKPISTYITAVLAGPYHRADDTYTRKLPDGSTLEIPLGALCRTSLAEHFDPENIFTVTKQGLDFYHDNFDYPYPFGKYDQAFVPEYNLGAMENPGLVTFREELVFRGRVTEAARERRADIILHEMAHMWFGDLVTMEWWDDLWLKESFADYMGSLSLVEATRFHDGWISFANRRKAWAYRQDQMPTTHPITADIHDLEDAKLNFDGITYAKGASVLKQLVAYVGRDAFMEGARRYFKRHQYANTTLADLLSVLEETSGRDMAAWAGAWLQTAGVNSLTPQVRCGQDGRITELAVVQRAPEEHPVLRPHRVAVALYRRGADGAVTRAETAEVDVTGERTVVGELAGADRPDLVLVNDGDLTYCKVRFDEGSLAALRDHLGDVADPLARALCWAAAWDLTRDGLLRASDFLELVLRFASRESDIGVLQNVHQQARYALSHYVAPARRAAGARRLADGALEALRAAGPGSGHQLAWARFYASVAEGAEDLKVLRRLLDGELEVEGLDVDQELRWAFLEPLAAQGVADRDVLEEELRRDDTASGRRHQLRCLASRPSAEVKASAWRSVVESDSLPNALVQSVIDGFAQPGQRELLLPYVEAYFGAIEGLWASRTIATAMRLVSGLFPLMCDLPSTLERADEWLRGGSEVPMLRRLVVEGREDLARALRAQEVDGG